MEGPIQIKYICFSRKSWLRQAAVQTQNKSVNTDTNKQTVLQHTASQNIKSAVQAVNPTVSATCQRFVWYKRLDCKEDCPSHFLTSINISCTIPGEDVSTMLRDAEWLFNAVIMMKVCLISSVPFPRVDLRLRSLAVVNENPSKLKKLTKLKVFMLKVSFQTDHSCLYLSLRFIFIY